MGPAGKGNSRPEAAVRFGSVARTSGCDQLRRLLGGTGFMWHLLRWIGIAVGGLVGLSIVGYAVVYGLSERILRRTYEVPAVVLTIPTDPDSIREGRRLATVRGCFHDCHGTEAEGHVLFDDPMIARIVAPNLTAAVRQY